MPSTSWFRPWKRTDEQSQAASLRSIETPGPDAGVAGSLLLHEEDLLQYEAPGVGEHARWRGYPPTDVPVGSHCARYGESAGASTELVVSMTVELRSK